MPAYEPRGWKAKRQQTLADQYPELAWASPDQVLQVDTVRTSRGELPSRFTQDMVSAANHFSQTPEERRQKVIDRAMQEFGRFSSVMNLAERVRQMPMVRDVDLPASANAAGFADLRSVRVEEGGGPNLNPMSGVLEALGDVGGPALDQLARPGGAFRGSISALENAPVWQAPVAAVEGAVEGFRNPNDFKAIDSSLAQEFSDEDVLGSLSPRDIVAGVIDIGLDPVDLVTGGLVATDAARLISGGVRRFGDDAAETAIKAAEGPLEASTRGVLDLAPPKIPGARIAGGAEEPVSRVYQSPPTVARLYGSDAIEEGATRGRIERFLDTGQLRPDDPVASPALLVRAEARRNVTNQATRTAETARSLINDAELGLDEAGRIQRLAGIDPDIPGAPTLRDVAARLPRFEPYLTDEQLETLHELRDLLAPYRQALDEVAQAESAITGKPSTLTPGSRADVMEGGFYIPRGTAETEELADIASRRYRGQGSGRSGREGFERTATFGSEAEGIEAGFEYTPVAESIGSYVRGIGNRTLDRDAANYFLTRVDDSGRRLAESVADRVDPQLRSAVEGLRSRISSRLQTLRGQTVRGSAQGAEAARAERVAGRAEELAENAAGRAEAARASRTSTVVVDTADDIVAAQRVVDDTDGVLKAAERELRLLETQARQSASRADSAVARAGRTDAARQATADEIAALREELAGLNQRWQQAQSVAAQTPRDQGRIPLRGLESYSFPWEIADEARRILDAEAPRNRGAAVAALNSILRGMQATGEMSYLGIQGAIGMASGNRAWRRAARSATEAWMNGGENALGTAMRNFDRRVIDAGRPTLDEWAASGLHLGGGQTEFAIRGRGLLPEASGAIGKAQEIAGSIPKRADRGFGAFGDIARMELADMMAEESLAAGRALNPQEMKAIAESVNRVTGWTPQRLGGSVGEALNFAPRYFAARLRALGQLGSRDPRQRQLARRLIGRYIAIASTMTIAANMALGEETDFRPFSGKNGPTWNPLDAEYKNPNFMRIRNVAGRDWSLLGPVDATLGAVIGAGSLLTNPTSDPKEWLGRTRTILSAPLVSAGLDWLVFGEDFDRNELNSPEALARDIIKRVVPFAAPELLESAQDIQDAGARGDVGGALLEAAGGVAQGLFGGRGSRLTTKEQVESGGYQDLSGIDQFKGIPAETWRILSTHPEVGADVQRYGTYGQWYRRVSDQLYDQLIDEGMRPGEAMDEVNRAMRTHPVYQAYMGLRNDLRTRWVMDNPDEASNLWDEEARKPDPDWTPTKEQKEMLESYREAQRAKQ